MAWSWIWRRKKGEREPVLRHPFDAFSSIANGALLLCLSSRCFAYYCISFILMLIWSWRWRPRLWAIFFLDGLFFFFLFLPSPGMEWMIPRWTHEINNVCWLWWSSQLDEFLLLLCLPVCLVGKKRGGEPWGNFCVTSSFSWLMCISIASVHVIWFLEVCFLSSHRPISAHEGDTTFDIHMLSEATYAEAGNWHYSAH